MLRRLGKKKAGRPALLPGELEAEGRRHVYQATTLFLRAMRREMKANRHKNAGGKGWENVPPKELVADLTYHAAKLARAVYEQNPTRIIEHAADVGNLAWMVADSAGVLNGLAVEARACEPDLMEWDTPTNPAQLAVGPLSKNGGTNGGY